MRTSRFIALAAAVMLAACANQKEPAEQAVAYVRRHYHPHAVETFWQRRFVGRFQAP